MSMRVLPAVVHGKRDSREKLITLKDYKLRALNVHGINVILSRDVLLYSDSSPHPVYYLYIVYCNASNRFKRE